MKKLLIYLTQEQYDNVRERAREAGVTMSSVIRNSLNSTLDIISVEELSPKKSVPISPEEAEELLNSRTPEERYLFDPEIIKFSREFKASQKK